MAKKSFDTESDDAAGVRLRQPLTERLARWSASHWPIAVFGWILLVIAAVAGGQAVGMGKVTSYNPGQSGQAERVLARPGVAPPLTESVLLRLRTPGPAFRTNPELQQATRAVVAALAAMPAVTRDITSPLPALAGGPGAGLVSADGQAVLVTFAVAGDQAKAATTIAPAQRAVAGLAARYPGLEIGEAGNASVTSAINDLIGKDFRRAEMTSVPITLVLLLLVFGALIAAGIPLLLAGAAVASAISLLSIPSKWLPIDSTTSSVVLLVGMAVGIDYTLFYLRREREERAAGASAREAIRIAAATSGRAIVISGLTVMISLGGLFVTGIDVFSGLAVGTIMVVGISVLGSLTALPGLLGMLRGWVDRGRVPFLGRRRTLAARSVFWTALSRRVVRRPLIWGGVAAIALLATAWPGAHLRLASPGFRDLPSSVPVIKTLTDMQRAFPGGPAPAEIVVTRTGPAAPALDSAAVREAVTALASRAAAGGPGSPIHGQLTATLLGHNTVLLIAVPLTGMNPADATSIRSLAQLRDSVLPATVGKVPGLTYVVTGTTAANHDFVTQLDRQLPWVFAVVLGMALILLLVTFRSVAIPLVSIALNLLSVGAAYGLLTLIFQDGHLSGLLGFTPYGGIVPWMPLFLFVLLFGLSMDYHVFILSRIREHWLAGADARQAVVAGTSSSAGVVTSAAAIMVAVFSIFATLSVLEFKMFGVGMAAAVLIDATIVRGVLMPAALAALGPAAWWLPGGRRRRVAAAPESIRQRQRNEMIPSR